MKLRRLSGPSLGDCPNPDNPTYVPTTRPGARLPHIWLDAESIEVNGFCSAGFSLWNSVTPSRDSLANQSPQAEARATRWQRGIA